MIPNWLFKGFIYWQILTFQEHDHFHEKLGRYNATYPLTKPLRTDSGVKYRIAVISDLDQDSKLKDSSNKWASHMKFGHLTISDNCDHVSIHFDDKEDVTLQVYVINIEFEI